MGAALAHAWEPRSGAVSRLRGNDGGLTRKTSPPLAVPVQVDPDSQVTLPRCDLDLGDVNGPLAIGGCWIEFLQQQELGQKDCCRCCGNI